MPNGIRANRVAERVRVELSTLLARSVRDPGIASVAITRVSMSADLQLARVFYTLVVDGDRHEAAKSLRRARSYLRRKLAQRIQLRYVPELRFAYDDSAEKQDRIARLLDEIANTRDVAEPEQGANSEDANSEETHGA